ncbi:hypothetical protein DL770_007006 [Monosporascus sp. CRB-9-2]|nr:hypothetical protein DL770_007006 [Monosporascus sp. CRB-9-2]
MRQRAHETVEYDDFDSLSPDGSSSKKNFLVVDPIHREENGQDVAFTTGRTGTLKHGDSVPRSPYPRPRRRLDSPESSKEVVSWRDMPKKTQLVVIVLARLSEPLAQTSLQLKWFDPNLPDSVISSQAGSLHASFTAAQLFTALIWGRVADSPWFGRKTVILIGLLGTFLTCIGFGFSTSFYQALVFRCLGGATSGNVGVLRTMISETVQEKKYQARAFVLLPMCFNIGVIIGPILGGLLSDPASSYPDMFGNVDLFRKFPYAMPNITIAIFLCFSLIAVWMFLEETHDAMSDRRDYGIMLGLKIRNLFRRRNESVAYTPLHSIDMSISTDVEMSPVTPRRSVEGALPLPQNGGSRRRYTAKLPFCRIFTFNVVMTFVAHFFLAFGLGTFNSLWAVFLSTPVFNPEKPEPPGFAPRPPFAFTGGLGLSPQKVGGAMALLGVIGIILQLFLYPKLSARLGTLRSYRMFIFCFPIAYTLMPYLSLVPSTTPPPSEKTGPWVWIALVCLLSIQVVGRTFALPAQIILVNNCSPHPSVLGTVHGFGVSVSSFARTVGPILCGWLYGIGLSRGCVGAVFWGLTGVALCGWAVSFWLKEGNGHEIWLEGDEEDEYR